MSFERNVGRLDRVGRAVLGLVLLGFAIFCPFAQTLGPLVVWASGLAGAALLASAAVGVCFVYRLFGLDTGR